MKRIESDELSPVWIVLLILLLVEISGIAGSVTMSHNSAFRLPPPPMPMSDCGPRTVNVGTQRHAVRLSGFERALAANIGSIQCVTVHQ